MEISVLNGMFGHRTVEITAQEGVSQFAPCIESYSDEQIKRRVVQLICQHLLSTNNCSRPDA
jgi:hypothetical protein